MNRSKESFGLFDESLAGLPCPAINFVVEGYAGCSFEVRNRRRSVCRHRFAAAGSVMTVVHPTDNLRCSIAVVDFVPGSELYFFDTGGIVGVHALVSPTEHYPFPAMACRAVIVRPNTCTRYEFVKERF